MASAAVDKRIESYRRLHIYGTKSRLYVVGHDEQFGTCRILKFRRQDGPRLDVVEDPLVYTPDQCALVLRKVHEQSGGLQLICKGHGIIGCFRFTDSYYLLVIARREYVGHICGHKVYRIAETCLISLSATQQRIDMAAADSTAEKRYRKLLLGVDLTKNFFFAYSYSLAHTLQHNHKQAAAAAAAANDSSSSTAADTHNSTTTTTSNNNNNNNNSSSRCEVAGLPKDTESSSTAAAAAAASGWDVYDGSMFVWNAYLTRPLRVGSQSTRWTLPLIHGFWDQRQVSVFGRQLTLTLLARRSRHFAGTRFRKRGLSAQGFVANEVETEQIVDAGVDWATGQPLWAAVVQVRGSVPLFWSQQTTPLSPKPDILLQQFDPIYEKTSAHFSDLKRRYGDPIIALNLLKSKERRPREVLLRKEFAAAVSLLNSAVAPDKHIVYIPWDFQQHAKQPGANILLELHSIMELCLNASGIYVHGPASCSSCQPAIQQRLCCKLAAAADTAAAAPKQRHFAPQTQLQHGVLRTNCIDCLDRTNVVQFAYGLAAFGRQLSALGVLEDQGVDSDSSIALQLMEMYEAMGHTLALQYGGSEAHAAFFKKKRGEWEATTQSRDLMTSIRRFYSNAYTDAEKQDAINLFLGNYVPVPNAPPIWELDSDYYLHTDAAIKYSQLVCSDRLPAAPIAAFQAAAAAAASDAAAGTQVVTAGGRNAPVILRQLSVTTLPPSAFGFGSNVSSAAAAANAAAAATSLSSSSSIEAGGALVNGSSTDTGVCKPYAASVSPFATAAAAAAAAAAAGSSVGGSCVSTPLLPLTFSDGISIEACDTDSGPNVTESAFNFKIVFQQMLTAPVEHIQIDSTDGRSRLISFDNVMAKMPRTSAVRLYPTVYTKKNVMWEAVQQAFTFFSAEQGLDAAAAAAGSSSSSFVHGNMYHAGSFTGAAAAAAGTESSIQSLDLTATAAKRQQQLAAAAAAAAGSSNGSSVAAAGGSSSDTSSPRVMIQSAESPKTTAAAAAAAAAAGQMPNTLGGLNPGLRSPPAPAVSSLNDILEIRTDITPVRLISSADKPPKAIGPQGPVIPLPPTLDATLDELMWSQFGININNTSVTQSNNSRYSASQSFNCFSDLTDPSSQGLAGMGSGIGNLGFSRPGSPTEASGQGLANKVWGGITTLGGLTTSVVRGRGAAAAAASNSGAAAAAGQKGLSPLNDILQVQQPVQATAAAAAAVVVKSNSSSSSNAVVGVTAAAAIATGTPKTGVVGSSNSSSGSSHDSSSSGVQYALSGIAASRQCTAGRITFLPAGAKGYPFSSSSSSSALPAAAAVAASEDTSALVTTSPLPQSPLRAAASDSSAADASNIAAAAAASSSKEAEWLEADGQAFVLTQLSRQQRQQQQQRGLIQNPLVAGQILGGSFISSTQQQQQFAASYNQPGMAQTAASVSGVYSSQQQSQQQQQQRLEQCYSMFAPVDAAAAAAAFGLRKPSSSQPAQQQSLAIHQPTSPLDAFIHSSSTEQQQQCTHTSNSSGGSSSSSSTTDWVPSANVTGPSLQSWGLTAGQLGLSPEVQAVWWGLADLPEVWFSAQEVSCEAYRQYYRGVLQLQDIERVEVLHSWYEAEQFRTPVVIGAA